MSEPMSNVEIEDVLSSIRRLVSYNSTRSRPGAAPDLEEEGHNGAPTDALVLTPALRVGTEGDDEPEAAESSECAAEPDETGATALETTTEDPAPEPSPDDTAAPADPLWEVEAFDFRTGDAGEEEPEEAGGDTDTPEEDALGSRVAGLEAAFGTRDEYEPDGSEVAASEETYDWEDDDTVIDLSTPDVPSGTPLFLRSTGARAASARADDLSDDAEALTGAADGDDASASSDGTEEDTPALSDVAEADWAAPVDETADADAADQEDWPEPEEDWTAPELPRPAEEQAQTAPSDRRETAEDGPPLLFRASPRGNWAPEPVADEPESVQPEAAEAAGIAPDDLADDEFSDDEFQPDEDHGDDTLEAFSVGTEGSAARPMDDEADPWEDADDPHDDGIDEAALAAALEGPNAPALIDEERITEMVAEVVRSELRGALGERITQNVRKLVRREIARALETRGIR